MPADLDGGELPARRDLAGGQAQGTIYIWISGSSACGKSVGLTASSGSASASAQSPQDLQC